MAAENREELEALRVALNAAQREVAQVDGRLRELERAAGVPPGPRTDLPQETQPRDTPRRPRAPRPPRRGFSIPSLPDGWIERFRALVSEGNPLNKLGAVSLIVGAAIVFKYAVDNQWIGPTGRVALGFAVGAVMFGLGEFYSRKGWKLFASGLAGAGAGIFFVALYFGQQQYEIVPAPLAIALYVLLTAAVVVQSLRYDNMGLAIWGLLGGYLTPALASTGSGNYVFLSAYLLVLNTGVFAVAFYRNWQPLKWMAFLLTAPYMALWVEAYESSPQDGQWLELHWILPFLATFFAFFAAIPTWRSLVKSEPIDRFGRALTVVNGIWHFALAIWLLGEEHRIWLGAVAVAVTAIYAFITSQLVKQREIDAQALRVYAGTAAGFLLLATPFLATGAGITLAWCAQTSVLAWVCTRERFDFLRLHVLVMLGVIGLRLFNFDGLLVTELPDPESLYLPFAQLSSWPPFAAAATFLAAGVWLGRLPAGRIPVSWIFAGGLFVLMAAVQGEVRLARTTLAPFATVEIQRLAEAGLLVTIMCGLWAVALRAVGEHITWFATAGFTALLLMFMGGEILWIGGYGGLRNIVGQGLGLWWLHAGVLMMLPILLLFASLARDTPERVAGFSRETVRAACFAAAILIAMLLLRREVFALTHGPPLGDLFGEMARRAAYRTILSLGYAMMAFGIYVRAIQADNRRWLQVAYALYVFTAFKVYVFDLESQNQLYRAFSLLVFAAILFVSSYYANRQKARHA